MLSGVHPAGAGRRKAGPEQRAGVGLCLVPRVRKAKSALVLGDYGLPHHAIARSGALFAMQDMPWDHGLTVTADGEGLSGMRRGHPAGDGGPVGADRGAEGRAGQGRAVPGGGPRDGDGVGGGDDRAGGTSMSGIAVLDHLALVLGGPVTWQTLRRTLDLADPATLEKIAQARARIRATCGTWSRNGGRAGTRGQ